MSGTRVWAAAAGAMWALAGLFQLLGIALYAADVTNWWTYFLSNAFVMLGAVAACGVFGARPVRLALLVGAVGILLNLLWYFWLPDPFGSFGAIVAGFGAVVAVVLAYVLRSGPSVARAALLTGVVACLVGVGGSFVREEVASGVVTVLIGLGLLLSGVLFFAAGRRAPAVEAAQ
jgi:hypothetical protein